MSSMTRVLSLRGAIALSVFYVGVTTGLSAAVADKEPVDYAVTANSDFAVNLYKQLSKEKQGKNLFFSPYSISSALTMTAEGARGETAEQMGQVLCFPKAAVRIGSDSQLIPWNVALIHSGITELNQRYNTPKLPYKVGVANALWGEQSHPFLQSYIDTIHKYYKTGGLFAVDFRHAPEAVRLRINRWVEEQTADKIKDLIPKRLIDSSTRLVLTNAIYFKGEWQDQFETYNTRSRDFNVSPDKKVKVPMMFKADGFRYAEDGSLQVVELPYKGRDLSMLVILPREIDGLPD